MSGVAVSGYEIHLGQTAQHPAMALKGDVAQPVLPNALGWQNLGGNVLGVYLHGLFEDAQVLTALLGHRQAGLEPVFDALAQSVAQHFEPGWLAGLVDQAQSAGGMGTKRD